MKANLEAILEILRDRGQEQYGREAVSQLEHALQCATLAEADGQSYEMITACLLHDLGHLLHDLGDDVAERGIDDRHEYRAIPFLTQLFPAAVTEPIRLHVEAKRYLCAVNSTYWESLSPASKRSLELQGGIFSPAEAEAFINQPFAKDAVQLRIWDDRAKVPHQLTSNLDRFVAVLNSLLMLQQDSNYMPLNIRPATRDDLKILNHLYAEMDCKPELSPILIDKLFTAIEETPNYTIYLAYLGDEPVGTFSLLFVPTMMHPSFHKFAVIDAVTILPAYRGKGIGKQMMGEALAMSRAAGCYKVTLSSNLKRDRAHAFYESLGFQQHGWSFSLALPHNPA